MKRPAIGTPPTLDETSVRPVSDSYTAVGNADTRDELFDADRDPALAERLRKFTARRVLRSSTMRLPIVLALALAPLAIATVNTSTAFADEPTQLVTKSEPATYDLGFRIGGYGFRRATNRTTENPQPGREVTGDWSECRMNGFGLFASRALPGPLFLEAGLDAYFSKGDAPSSDLPIDRASGLVSTAIGARSSFTSWLRGYVQIGGGVELTRVSVPYSFDRTIRDQKVMPIGFLGFGVEIEVANGTHLGAAFRTLVMGNFDYDPMKLDTGDTWVAAPAPEVVFDASPDLANQGQFYLRRDL